MKKTLDILILIVCTLCVACSPVPDENVWIRTPNPSFEKGVYTGVLWSKSILNKGELVTPGQQASPNKRTSSEGIYISSNWLVTWIDLDTKEQYLVTPQNMPMYYPYGDKGDAYGHVPFELYGIMLDVLDTITVNITDSYTYTRGTEQLTAILFDKILEHRPYQIPCKNKVYFESDSCVFGPNYAPHLPYGLGEEVLGGYFFHSGQEIYGPMRFNRNGTYSFHNVNCLRDGDSLIIDGFEPYQDYIHCNENVRYKVSGYYFETPSAPSAAPNNFDYIIIDINYIEKAEL